jgi:hypothetical protein
VAHLRLLKQAVLRGVWVMDPVTLGAVLAAIVSGVGSQLGTQLWDGAVSLARRPFRHKTGPGGDAAAAAMVPSGEAELTALQQDPGDQRKAVALAEVLLARSGADEDFQRALENWWEQAEPIRVSIENVTNTISGGTQHGPVLQGRDFSNITFGAAAAPPPVQPS